MNGNRDAFEVTVLRHAPFSYEQKATSKETLAQKLALAQRLELAARKHVSAETRLVLTAEELSKGSFVILDNTPGLHVSGRLPTAADEDLLWIAAHNAARIHGETVIQAVAGGGAAKYLGMLARSIAGTDQGDGPPALPGGDGSPNRPRCRARGPDPLTHRGALAAVFVEAARLTQQTAEPATWCPVPRAAPCLTSQVSSRPSLLDIGDDNLVNLAVYMAAVSGQLKEVFYAVCTRCRDAVYSWPVVQELLRRLVGPPVFTQAWSNLFNVYGVVQQVCQSVSVPTAVWMQLVRTLPQTLPGLTHAYRSPVLLRVSACRGCVHVVCVRSRAGPPPQILHVGGRDAVGPQG